MIREWEEISKIEGPIKMHSSDWFYMPYSVWNDTKYWLALSKLKNRFEHGNYPYHESLWKIVIPVAKIKKNHKEPDLKLHNKRVYLFIQFQIARTNKDKNLSNKLFEKYPDWPELKALYERLKSS